MTEVSDALIHLERYQTQLDMDGVMVGVSRQALDILISFVHDALDAAEKAEPVAWMYPDGRAGHAVTMDRKVACDAFPGIANPVPLYTHPAPAGREGWKLVPVEPTEAMIEAGSASRPYREDDGRDEFVDRNTEGTWAAMLAAAPEAPHE